VTTPSDDEGRGLGRASSCAGCGASLGDDQRYCLECGARRGPLPPAIADQLASMLERGRAVDKPVPKSQPDKEQTGVLGFMPSPRAAAVAVMGMLAFGVMLGSAISPLAQSAGLFSILLEGQPAEPASEPEEIASVEPELEAELEAEEEPLPVTEPSSAFVPEIPEEAAEEPLPEPPPELPELEELPEVKHLFLIMLGENGYEETFGKTSPAPYLSKKLPRQGELLTNYYAVAGSDLANQVALVSGQGPTPETTANCPSYADVAPATPLADGQVEGNGCVYPAEVESVATQLAAAKLKWKAYIEDIGNGSGQPLSCRHPALGTPDPAAAPPTEGAPAPAPGDLYLTWRNPFVYFHSLTDGAECAQRDVGFDQLTADLKKKATKVPALSYIVPDACHAGGKGPCEPGKPTGPVAAEEFLETLVPQIVASPAYKEGGLIAITSSLAPQSGEHADPSSCCIVPTFPNMLPQATPEPSTGPVKTSGGGGRVGMLLISQFVTPGTVNESGYFNHFTMLLTIEELFGLAKLGYANEIALAPFDSSVFNAPSSE
jgi:phosphatidylinositol-3-phosphatase